MRRLALIAALLVVGGAQQAFARSTPTERARVLYEQASRNYKSARFEVALRLIEEAQLLDPLPVYEGFRAWCIYRTGDEAEGVRVMHRLAELTTLPDAARKQFAGALDRMYARAHEAWIEILTRRADVRVLLHGHEAEVDSEGLIAVIPGSHEVELHEASHKETRLVRVAAGARAVVVYTPTSELTLEGLTSDATVEIDGKAVAHDVAGRLEVESGPRRLTVRSGDRVLLDRTLDVAVHVPLRVAVPAGDEADESERVPPRATEAAPRERASERGWMRWAPHAVMAAGAATFVGGAATWIVTARSASGVDAGDGRGSGSQRDAFDTVDTARDGERVGAALTAAGAAVAAGGLVWWWLSGDEDAEVVATPAGAALTLRF